MGTEDGRQVRRLAAIQREKSAALTKMVVKVVRGGWTIDLL